MLGLIKNMLAPKVGVRIVLRGAFPFEAVMKVQSMIRSTNLLGQVHLVQGSHLLIVLEGSKAKLDSLVRRLQKTPLTAGPIILEVAWSAYKKQFDTFRVSF